jgi:hypothetical protein
MRARYSCPVACPVALSGRAGLLKLGAGCGSDSPTTLRCNREVQL